MIAPSCLRPAGSQVLTVDPVVYGRHFDDRLPSPEGRGKAHLKRNLSDLAAMGRAADCAPSVVALTLGCTGPPRLAGVNFIAVSPPAPGTMACPIVGGDIAQAKAHPGRQSDASRGRRGAGGY